MSDPSKIAPFKKGKLNWEEKVELCNRWKESGLNKSQFCKKQGIPLPTFCEWCNRVWARQDISTHSKLTPVRILGIALFPHQHA